MSNMQVDVQALLQKQMNRRDFLKHVGVGFVALTGVATLVKTMSSLGGNNAKTVSSGYGSSVYGGTPKS